MPRLLLRILLHAFMSNALARRVSRLSLSDVNLAAVVMALDARVETLPYRRAGRWDVDSHIGAAGLAKEALVSLALTGALPRLLVVIAAGFGLGALVTDEHAWLWAMPTVACGAAALGIAWRVRRALASVGKATPTDDI